MAKYQDWLEPDGLTLIQGWARNGLNDEQIAKNIGISESTLYDWKKKYPDFSKALKRGKEVVDFEVENALLKSALSGNTTAQIFWLKNRRPNSWRERPETGNGVGDKSEKDALSKSLEEMAKELESD